MHDDSNIIIHPPYANEKQTNREQNQTKVRKIPGIRPPAEDAPQQAGPVPRPLSDAIFRQDGKADFSGEDLCGMMIGKARRFSSDNPAHFRLRYHSM